MTSAGRSTGAQGMRASVSATSAASALGKVSSHAVMTSRSARQLRRRASDEAKRGSRPSSGRCMSASSRSHSRGAPTTCMAM